MRTTDINWAAPGEPSDDHWLPLYRALPRGSFELLVLSRVIVGVITHWVQGRSIPCTSATGNCVCNKGGASKRWRGYIGCWEQSFSRQCLLELTEEACWHCNVPLLGDEVNLRGMIARAWRLGPHPQAPVRVELRPTMTREEDMPAEPSVEKALIRLWSGKGQPRPKPPA